MRVLHLINEFANGGRERRMVQLVLGLSHTGVVKQSSIVFSDRIDFPEVLNTDLEINTIITDSRKERWQRIEGIIKTFKPDIVHSWMDTPAPMFILPKLSKKYKFKYIAGFVADCFNLNCLSKLGLSTLYTFYKADIIISNSYAGLKAKHAPLKKSIVIKNGFDFGRIPNKVNSSLKQSLGINKTYLVTMCAYITPAKNWQSFVDIAQKAEEHNLDVFFLAVGGGPQLEYFRDEIKKKELSNIAFCGIRKDVESIMQISDIVLLLSYAEGISNSIMEAMAIGKPVIATNAGGTPEIISDGVDGYLVQIDDREETYALLEKLLSDSMLREKIGTSAQAKIKQEYNLDKMTSEYLNVYNNLLLTKG